MIGPSTKFDRCILYSTHRSNLIDVLAQVGSFFLWFFLALFGAFFCPFWWFFLRFLEPVLDGRDVTTIYVCYSGFPGVFLVAVFNTEGVLVGVSRDETRFQRAPPTAEGFRNTVAILAQGKPSG